MWRKISLLWLLSFVNLNAEESLADIDETLMAMVSAMLKESTTLNRGSSDWIQTVLIPGGRARTQTVALDDKSYTGLKARLIRSRHRDDATMFLFDKIAVSAVFEIENKNGKMHIKSVIKKSEACIDLPSRHIGGKRYTEPELKSGQYNSCKMWQEGFGYGQTETEVSDNYNCQSELTVEQFKAMFGDRSKN